MSSRRAFTLIELLTVIAILGLLASLILPAVVDARSAGQRLSCTNNQRQIGLGLQSYETTYGRFPGVYCGITGPNFREAKRQWSYSPSNLIAAWLDGQALASKIPTEQPLGVVDPDWSDLDMPAPSTLHCPSDSLAMGEASSYRYCRGNLPLWPADPGGAFVRNDQGFRVAEITDGLSHTAFVSERLVSIPRGGSPDRRRDLIDLGSQGSHPMGTACLDANGRDNAAGSLNWSREPVGTAWLSGRWLHASYYHLLPPNSDYSDCRNSDMAGLAVLTARSNHPGGVNLLLGDGSVQFVSDQIALEVWRARATRAGSD
jgi:prepilin-type N-terminal cleavage/methylation domain-containing protein/prepilin-type processing-associated H-X9-DG protein